MRSLRPLADPCNKVAVTGTIAVAKDGKSRVVTANDTDANGKKVTDKAYYDKQ